MSKLPKAPLLEVIFEIKWDIVSNNDIVDFQYLHGDLYSIIKETFPYRENLIPSDIPFELVKGTPVYRFRKIENGYPLIQIGPGLLTINTIDNIYFWEDFKTGIESVFNAFFKVFPKSKGLKLTPVLTYIDFFKINPDFQNAIEFINSNLHLNIHQDFLEDQDTNIKDINVTFNYQINKDTLSLNLRNGSIKDNKDGLVLQTKIIGENNIYTSDNLSNWLNETHDFSSSMFKKITKGPLYNSFK